MKNLLIAIIALGSISAFAGSLVTKDSEERLYFDFDSTSGVLTIESQSLQMESQSIQLSNVSQKKSAIKLFVHKDAPEEIEAPLIAYDLVLLPFKATIKGLTNKTYKKDFDLLMAAINADEETDIVVSAKRFKRILSLLK